MKEDKIKFTQEELEDIEFCVFKTLKRLQNDEYVALRAALKKLYKKVRDYNEKQSQN